MKKNPMVYYAQFEPAEEGGFVITLYIADSIRTVSKPYDFERLTVIG